MGDPEGRTRQLRELASRLGIEIKDAGLFDRALTHASITAEVHEPIGDYESLEFLGDAVLGLAVAHHLFEALPDRTPGEYSRMRAGMVNRRVVSRVAARLNIADMIRLGKGEELSGGRGRTALMADCLEALIGAVYLDSGWETARAVVVWVFGAELERAAQTDRVWDYKSRLQNYCQAERIPLPRFLVVRSEGPDHLKEFEVEVILQESALGRGRGHTKKEAEQNAAREALEKLGQCAGGCG
jgi:ribonuclease-3